MIVEDDDTLFRVFRMPRKYMSFPFGGLEIQEPSALLLEQMIARIERVMRLEKMTSKCWKPRSDLWMIAFFYGDYSTRRATYENGKSGSIKYIPRQVFYLVVDACNNILHVSLSDKRARATPDFLSALNGTLFEGRAERKPFYAFDFDLGKFMEMDFNTRYPYCDEAPWRALRMTELHYRLAAREDSGRITYMPRRDGFEEMPTEELAWPRYVEHIKLHCAGSGDAAESMMVFYHQTNLFRTSLTVKNIDAIAELIKIATDEGERLILLL
jgi:hypothetical protein